MISVKLSTLILGSLVAGAFALSGWVLLEVHNIPKNYALASDVKLLYEIHSKDKEILRNKLENKVCKSDFDAECAKLYKRLSEIDSKLQDIIMLLLSHPKVEDSVLDESKSTEYPDS